MSLTGSFEARKADVTPTFFKTHQHAGHELEHLFAPSFLKVGNEKLPNNPTIDIATVITAESLVILRKGGTRIMS